MGWKRFSLVSGKLYVRHLRYAFALALALSLGDLRLLRCSAIKSLLLYHLLYQQLGNYRNQDAAVTAGILLLLCGILFAFIHIGMPMIYLNNVILNDKTLPMCFNLSVNSGERVANYWRKWGGKVRC